MASVQALTIGESGYVVGQNYGGAIHDTACLANIRTSRTLTMADAGEVLVSTIPLLSAAEHEVTLDNMCPSYFYGFIPSVPSNQGRIARVRCGFVDVAGSPTFDHAYEGIPWSLPTEEIAGLNKIQGVGGKNGEPLTTVIGRIVFFFLSIIGSIGLVLFVYAGLLWMNSAGNAERQKKALAIMLWTTLGIVFSIGSWGIVRFIFHAFN